jgi:ankyrin repeat protein
MLFLADEKDIDNLSQLEIEEIAIRASQLDDLDTIKLLKSNGLDITIKDDAMVKGAAMCGSLKTLQYLINNAEDDISLMYACESGYLDIVQLLIKSGADIHARGSDGAMRWTLESEMDTSDVVSFLISKGLKY